MKSLATAPAESRENRESRLSNWLATLADEAGEVFREYQGHRAKSIERYLAAGRILAEARAECERGAWGAFLARAGINERTARRMVQVADAIEEGVLEPVTVTALGVRRALEFVSVANRADEAVANWRESWGAVKDGDDPDLRSAVLQSYPDGPLTAALWLDAV